MNKTARKPSSDPIQEKLRELKSHWNKDVSVFITDLINLKKTMNGWPSKFHMERSYIKDPIPADPHSILGVLASDFQELAQQGNSIIQQQLEYSKSRKKKQPKQPGATLPPQNNTPDLTQQLSAASLKFSLLAEGSNPLTRFFSRLKGPWFGDSSEVRIRKYRLSMLRVSALLEDDLEKFEAIIVGSSDESIFVASKMLHQIENHLKFIWQSLSALKILEGESTSLPSQEFNTENNSNEIDQASKIITDFRKNYTNFNDLDIALVKQFSNLILKFLADDSVKKELAPEIVNIYKQILNDLNNKRGTSADSLSDVLLKSKTANIHVISQNILNKWVGKLNHNINPFDKTSALRLDAANFAKECINLVDKLMNSLEKDFDSNQITSYLSEINSKIVMIKSAIKPLEATIQGKLFDKTFVNLLQDNKLTDYEYKLNSKQKDQLEKMIQTKQFRDLTNMYSKKR